MAAAALELAALPDELLLAVMRWLPARDLVRLALCSRLFARLAKENELWTRIATTHGYEHAAVGRAAPGGSRPR